jgi:TRAP transporter TAXI family solute receptor
MFPEPVHVVVRDDSRFRAVADLAGTRVSLGTMGSGTRYTALKVLEAHGLSEGDYIEVAAGEPGEALGQLASGKVDAVIAVVSAPWGQLSQSLTRTPLRLLPLDAETVSRMSADLPGAVALTLAARTYRGQAAAVPTVAATALLVVSSDAADRIVADALASLYAASAVPGAGVRGARLSIDRAMAGVTIPLHDGAARYLEQRSARPPAEIDSIER